MARIQSRRRPRKLKTIIMLFVDGEVEIEYFKHININDKNNIRFVIKKGNELDFIKNMYDEVVHMVILDIDATSRTNDPKNRYLNLEKLVKDKTVKHNVFFNNYSFETFLLLHVIKKVKPIYKGKDYDSLMKKHFNIDNGWYKNKNNNNMNKIFSLINDESVKFAIENCEKISHRAFDNPSTNMHLFFERMLEIDD